MADSTPRSRASSRSSRSRRASSARSRSTPGRRAAATRARSNGHAPLETVADTVGSAASKARGPLVAGGAAAAGAIGGIVLGARVLRPRRRKVLGIPIPRDGIGLKPLAHEVRKAGKQIGRMADEVGKARAQAEKIGKALS
jgi:hypothetical protein